MGYLKSVLLKRRRTKIVATLGPASSNPAIIRQLIEAGVNVFRLNMSHGDHEGHRTAYERVRAAAAEIGEPIAVLADLCGPKIRVGQFTSGEIELSDGSPVVVTVRDVPGEPGLIPSQYAALAKDVRKGARILLSDGLLELRVDGVNGTEVQCTVVHGGMLKDRKGINLPDVAVSAPSVTEKDRQDARFAMDLGVDFLALSFVRRAADVRELRALMPDDCPAQVIAKMEKPEALENAEEILDVSDGIMVARGDLGVEMPAEIVPIAQRELVMSARRKNKPAIVATQMLESMIDHPQATRAEVSDVANAVLGGADAVMLSAETASGKYPVRAVQVMDRVARQAEGYLWSEGAFGSIPAGEELEPPLPAHVAVAHSVAQLSRDLMVRAIVVLTRSGTTAGILSAARPGAPMLAVTADPAACRRMNLRWGVVPVVADPVEMKQPRALARRLVLEMGLAESGQPILMVSGFASAMTANAPTVTVLTV